MPLALVVASIAFAPTIAQEPLFAGLGHHHRAITTSSPLAQRYFDQGLAFLYGFNHDEAIRSFTQATVLDPQCAMAWWGIATANGPHINNPMVDPDHAKAALNALKRAQGLRANPVERALISAASTRFADAMPADRSGLDRAFANAMRSVWKRFPRDADVGAIFAESMMDLRPWDLWKADGSPQPGTLEIVATLQRDLRLDPNHPLANHLYVHAMEGSPHPERSLASADRLRFMEPGLGHMVHMPSHTYVRTGQWLDAIQANERAIKVDRAYREKVPNQGFYRIYMAHNQHMLAYAAMMRGESRVAIGQIDSMLKVFPEDWLKEAAPLVDGFLAMPFEVRVRFGQWDGVLDLPDVPDYFPLARTMRHGARAIAYAAKGDVENARSEQSLFFAAKAKVPAGATFGNNSGSGLLTVAANLMNGEIALAEKRMGPALDSLRAAVKAEDQLRYDEPPDWIQPTRHTLGAVLVKAGKFAEAEAVYRADLKKLPHNGWSLFGLARSLHGLGHNAEAKRVDAQFAKAWKDADIQIQSSCLCVKGEHS